MNALILLSILLSAALGIARGADLAFGTDAVTGLCTVGSVWWRYAALGAVVLAAVLIGRHCAGKAETVRSRQPLAGVLAFAGAVCFLAAARCAAGGGPVGNEQLRAVHSGVHLRGVAQHAGRCWLTTSGWKKPTGGLYLAVAGSVLFYWNVLMRFMENSSSWHRVAPTAAVWQALAALLLLSSLARALYLPKPDKRPHPVRRRSGSTLPVPVLGAAPCSGPSGGAAAEPALLPELFAALALCCVGALGGVCAAACARASGVTKTPPVLLV